MGELSEEQCKGLDAILIKVVGIGNFTENNIQSVSNWQELLKWLIENNRVRQHPAQEGLYMDACPPVFLATYHQSKIKELWEANISTKHPQDIRYLYWAINRVSINAALFIAHELKQPENLDLNNTKEEVERQLISLLKSGGIYEVYWDNTQGNYMITERGIYCIYDYFKRLKIQQEQHELSTIRKIEEKAKQDKNDKRENSKLWWQKYQSVVYSILVTGGLIYTVWYNSGRSQSEGKYNNTKSQSDTTPKDTLLKQNKFAP